MNDYYHADSSAIELINNPGNVTVKNVSNGLYFDGPGNDTALIFYPGAKVEYVSYAPLLMNLSSQGVDCFLVEMPFNLAILGKDNADEIINNSSYNYSSYYLSGHSLGGSMASDYVAKHENNISGLILLASYPTDKLNNVSVLSIQGSQDKVLNLEKYNDAKKYMPANYREYVIDGGNHAQFGAYNNQNNDGIATINTEKQINITTEQILSFIEEDYECIVPTVKVV